MAKGDDRRAQEEQQNYQREQSERDRAAQETRHTDLRSSFQNQYDEARAADAALRGQLESGYLGLGDYSQNLLRQGGGFGGGGGGGGVHIPGGIDSSRISNFASKPYSIYESLGAGLDDEFTQEWEKHAAGLGTSGASLDESEAAYRNFIATGGYQPGELEAMRASAMAPTSAIYRGAADEAQRQAGLTGRSASPAGAARLAREQSGQIGDIATRTEANIAQLQQEGRQFGATGLTTSAGQRAQIAQIGMEARLAVEQLDAQMRESGAKGMTEIEKERMRLELQNAALNQSAASARASAANAQAAGGSADARWIAAQRAAGLSGASNLYATTPAATALGMQGLLNEQALYTQQQLGNLAMIPTGTQPPQQGRDWLGTAGQIAQIGGAFL